MTETVPVDEAPSAPPAEKPVAADPAVDEAPAEAALELRRDGERLIILGSGFAAAEVVSVSYGCEAHGTEVVGPFDVDADGGFHVYGRAPLDCELVVTARRGDGSEVLAA